MAHSFKYLDVVAQKELKKVADSIATPGRGILAVDEFPDGIRDLLNAVGLKDTDENRRNYRQMLFTAPNLNKYVSGVIMYDETVWHKTDAGVPFPKHLESIGVNPGVKVDCNTVPLLGTDDEVTTQGLDDLIERCKRYKEAGCKFAKWRCVIKIDDKKPSLLSVTESAHVTARYAACCQQVSFYNVYLKF